MSKIDVCDINTLPSEWEEILNIIEKGKIEYRDALVFKDGDNYLLIGYDGRISCAACGRP